MTFRDALWALGLVLTLIAVVLVVLAFAAGHQPGATVLAWVALALFAAAGGVPTFRRP